MSDNESSKGHVDEVEHVPESGHRSKMTEDNNWDQRVGFLMHDVSRLRRMVFDSFVKPLGVTRSRWWVLACLSRQDGMNQSDLASVLELGKAALGGLLDRLESSGLIERRADGNDRRAKRIYLTHRGHQTVKEMHHLSHQMSERVLEGLSHDQRLLLARMFALLKSNLLSIKQERGMDSI